MNIMLNKSQAPKKGLCDLITFNSKTTKLIYSVRSEGVSYLWDRMGSDKEGARGFWELTYSVS